MSEKTKEVKMQYSRITHEEMTSTFDNQSMSMGCVGKLGHLFGFLRHYLLISNKLSKRHMLFHCERNVITRDRHVSQGYFWLYVS